MISLLLATLPLVLLALLLGLLLGYVGIKLKADDGPVIEMIDKLLPQTQCGQCNYPGCRPYAEAMAEGDTINKCPPGGDQGIRALARLLGKKIIPLDNNLEAKTQATVTFIREDDCIGCTKCIDACPVDAIVGTAKMMHTVIIDQCTGCDLCIPPCPVDCIDIHYLPQKVNIKPQPKPEQPCIRCGQCADVCPVGLLPQQLFWFSRSGELDKSLDYRLMDCIECGACEDVCPSQIPLLSHYQFSKAEIKYRTDVETTALQSKQRFDVRNLRLQRQQLEKQQRSKEKAAKVTEKSQAVADALARIQAKKAAKAAAQSAQQDNNHV